MGRAGGNAGRTPGGGDVPCGGGHRRSDDADGLVPLAASAGDTRLCVPARRHWATGCNRRGMADAGRLWREGWSVPAAYLAAESAPGCARARVGALVGHPDKIRRVRADCAVCEPDAGQCRVRQRADDFRRDYDVPRRTAGAVLHRPQANARLLVDEPNRLHHAGAVGDGAAG